MDRYPLHTFRALISLLLVCLVEGQTLQVPSAGNCGENIYIYCRYSGSCSVWSFYRNNGRIYRSSDGSTSKYSSHHSSGYIRLTVKSMALSDQGYYYCTCSSGSSKTAYLRYECKPTTISSSVTLAKKMSISFSGAYPEPSIAVSVNSATKSGRPSCSRTSNSHYNCNWLSSHSLGDGSNSYAITITTVSNKQFTGRLQVSSPRAPTISSMESVDTFGHVVRGYEDRQVKLECISRGGRPAPLVSWYNGGSELTKTSVGSRQSDGTYTVILTYIPTARRNDDLKTFTCKSRYHGATNAAAINLQESSARLYLYLKPSQPIITQVNTIVNDGVIEFECKTSGSRPAPSIVWNFKGIVSSPELKTQEDSSKISTTVSTFKKEVSVVDNGETVTCIVKHIALYGDLRKSVNADVKFAVQKGSTVLSGNKQVTLTISNSIDLTCTTGSSNPASTITWMNGSLVIPNPNPYSSKKGTNNGVIRTQVLSLALIRYMDGDVISCDVTNDDKEVAADQGNAVTDEVVLDILYPPEVQLSPSTIYTYEGTQDFVLPCIVTSKPHSAFWWYRRGIDPYILRHSGFSLVRDFYSYNFTFPMVTSGDAGEYRCKADNGIGTTYSPYIRFVVKYLRVSAPQSISVGQGAALNYTLHNIDQSIVVKPWVHEWPYYGEVKRYTFTRDFVLTNMSYQHSGTYTVSVKERNGDAIFLTRSTTLFVKSPPVIISPVITHGRHTVSTKLGSRVDVDIHYYSNIAGDHVKLYRKHNGVRILEKQSSVLLTPVQIQLPVMSSVITTAGTLCSIAIYIKREEDYGDFDIVIDNGVGSGTVFPISVIDAGFELRSSYITIIVGGVIDIAAVVCVIYLTVFLHRRKLIRCGHKKPATNENFSRSFQQLEEITETDIDNMSALSVQTNESPSSCEDTEYKDEDNLSENGVDGPTVLAVTNEHYSSSFRQLEEITEKDINNISAKSVKTNESPSSCEDTESEDEDNLSENGADGPTVLDENEGQTSSPSSCEDTENENEDTLSENGVDGPDCPGETEGTTPGSVEQIEKTNDTTTDSTDENLASDELREYQKLEAKATEEGTYQHQKQQVAGMTGKAPRQYEKLDAEVTEAGAYQQIKPKVADITDEVPRQYEKLDAKAKEGGVYQQIKSKVADITSEAPRQYEKLDAKAKEGGAYQQIKSKVADIAGETPRHYEKLDAKSLERGTYQQIESKVADITGPKGSKYENLEIKTFPDKSAGETVSSPPGMYEEISPAKPDHIYDMAFPRKQRKGFFLFGLFSGKRK